MFKLNDCIVFRNSYGTIAHVLGHGYYFIVCDNGVRCTVREEEITHRKVAA